MNCASFQVSHTVLRIYGINQRTSRRHTFDDKCRTAHTERLAHGPVGVRLVTILKPLAGAEAHIRRAERLRDLYVGVGTSYERIVQTTAFGGRSSSVTC
jgi:hypothetical protein